MIQRKPQFRVAFIYVALGIALGSGFVLGTHIALPMGFGWNLPDHLAVWIQVHGHLQLIGWTGLFVIGVSLHFLPRLLKASLPYPRLPVVILILVSGGVVIRSAAEFLIPYARPMPVSQTSLSALPFAATAEWVGVMLYLFVLLRMMAGKGTRAEDMNVILPFFMLMAAGWFAYESLQLAQVFLFDVSERLPWNDLSVELFIACVLFPVSMAFAVKTFPLFLQVPPVHARMRRFGVAYVLLTLFSLGPQIPGLGHVYPGAITLLADASRVFRSVIMILMVWELKLYQKMFFSSEAFLAKYFRPGYVEARRGSGAFQRARKGYYDYGEFGRFELLLLSAFCWLTLYAFLDFADAGSDILGTGGSLGRDPVRHAFLLGYVTLLIMGMGVRMLPGFVRQNRVANPWAVFWVFVFGNIAAMLRVIPLALPDSWIEADAPAGRWMMAAFGLSGVAALIAVSLFALCLVGTLRGRKPPGGEQRLREENPLTAAIGHRPA